MNFALDLLKFDPKVKINNIPALVQIMAWCRSGDKPLSEPMMVKLLMHICVTQPQLVEPVFDWLTRLIEILHHLVKSLLRACVDQTVSTLQLGNHSGTLTILYSLFVSNNTTKFVPSYWVNLDF